MNPYDFEKEFKDWFEWCWSSYYYKLTNEQIRENINAKKMGWKLCEGFNYGCWTYTKNHTKKYSIRNKIFDQTKGFFIDPKNKIIENYFLDSNVLWEKFISLNTKSVDKIYHPIVKTIEGFYEI